MILTIFSTKIANLFARLGESLIDGDSAVKFCQITSGILESI
jgi:hypothetical protein